MQQLMGRLGAVQEIVQIEHSALAHVIVREQHIRHKQTKVLRGDGWQAVRQRLKQAYEVVGKGSVETQKAVVTVESVEQVADDLRDVVQVQTLVFSNWPP